MSNLLNPVLPRSSALPAPAIHTAVAKRSGIRYRPLQQKLWTSFLNLALTIASLPAAIATAFLLTLLNPFCNPGPLIFRQERLGQNGRTFRIYKFRSMVGTTGGGEPLYLFDNELRITRLGAILRKYRLDELPNFINVARGEMNVIGPRPDTKANAEVYCDMIERYRERFEVKPGITGLAQVMQGYADSPESTRKKVRWDRFYVRRRSASLDLVIILHTLAVLATGSGSR